MTKNEVIAALYTGKNFCDCISKMEPDYLREDLKAEVISIVCEWPEEKILKLHEDKALEFYVVRVILNQIQSKTSPFFRKYRNFFVQFDTGNWEIRDNIELFEYEQGEVMWSKGGYDKKMELIYANSQSDNLKERQTREALEDITIEQINTLYWYDAELLRLYMRLGNFRAIEKETGIPFISCYKNIQKSIVTLRKRLTGEIVPLFSKEEMKKLKS